MRCGVRYPETSLPVWARTSLCFCLHRTALPSMREHRGSLSFASVPEIFIFTLLYYSVLQSFKKLNARNILLGYTKPRHNFAFENQTHPPNMPNVQKYDFAYTDYQPVIRQMSNKIFWYLAPFNIILHLKPCSAPSQECGREAKETQRSASRAARSKGLQNLD